MQSNKNETFGVVGGSSGRMEADVDIRPRVDNGDQSLTNDSEVSVLRQQLVLLAASTMRIAEATEALASTLKTTLDRVELL